jgi:hypothetical protein
MQRITKEILISAGACFRAVRDFHAVYPKGCEVCWMCFKEARDHRLPVGWLTHLLFPGYAGYDRRIAFKNRYMRYPHGKRCYMLATGLKCLERELLKAKAPKLNKKRIASYQFWLGLKRP